ncbi:MAG: adenylosuccinate synthase [Dehalococcoidia bacterium]|jgi:adenylosuccinate synthase|nr:adenylosuccinate synthase [Dehalococcoidia bacterium]
MGATAVIGAQWGDEGKGKVIDLLAERADLVVRYSGGNNAGHTVINHLGEFRLHLVPAGIFNEQTTCVIGNGVAVDPEVLIGEMDQLEASGIDTTRLMVSDRAHLVLPFHRLLDRLEEERLAEHAIGTTLRGIGPAFSEKTARRGIRAGDLADREALLKKLEAALTYANLLITRVYGHDPLQLDEIFAKCMTWGDRLSGRIQQTELMINEALHEGREVLLEGAQGTLLDLDFGTYPFVTSSHPGASGAYQGAGIGPVRIERIVGIFKAYCTRVGEGPFPTELHTSEGDHIREFGHEYGVTTGRPRRIGWFDAPMARLSNLVNGYTSVILTRLDVLDQMETISVCTGYRLDGEVVEYPPSGMTVLLRCEPILEQLEGWQQSTNDFRHFQDLPDNARTYVHRLEELIGAPVSMLSVGPRRDENIIVRAAL